MRKRKGKSKREWMEIRSKSSGQTSLSSPPLRSTGIAEHPDVPMSSVTRDALLKLALPLVKNHGFTRRALSLAAMHSPSGNHTAPLSDTAVDALFGEGDEARRTLIHAWLDDARVSLRTSYGQGSVATSVTQTPNLSNVLKARLSRNEDVLEHLPGVSAGFNPDVFPLLMRPSGPLRHSLSLPHPQRCPLSSSL